jgi:hypothetical protein
MPDEIPLCWSCQTPFAAGPGNARGRIWLTSDLAIPVCPGCWQEMSVAERIEAARVFIDRGESGTRIAEALESLIGMIERAGGGFWSDMLDRHDDTN